MNKSHEMIVAEKLAIIYITKYSQNVSKDNIFQIRDVNGLVDHFINIRDHIYKRLLNHDKEN